MNARHLRTLALAGAATFASLPVASHATEGYFQNGTSVRDKGVAGAGIADPDGAMVLASNPAGIATIDSEVEIGAALFMPRRSFTTAGDPGFTPDGRTESGSNFFVIPNAAASFAIDDASSIGIAIYGNGGLNTNWGAPTNNACISPPLPASDGVFCGGGTGVDLIQGFVSVGYARTFGGKVSVGVAPVLALQAFEGRGLAAFAFDPSGNPLTVDPEALTDNGRDVTVGVGLKVGALIEVSEDFRLAGSYQSEIDMGRFDKYAGLFENGGDFDIPSAFQLGAALDVSEKVTVMADYRHINIEDVPAVANSSTIQQQFGSQGGPGFGWENVDAFKFGVEAQMSDALTLRGGMAFNNNPVPGSDATINILAPGVSDEHYTLGARFGSKESGAFDVSLLYSPTARTTGVEITPGGVNPGRTVTLEMRQFEVGVAWSKAL